jgi:hypothetical protein
MEGVILFRKIVSLSIEGSGVLVSECLSRGVSRCSLGIGEIEIKMSKMEVYTKKMAKWTIG